MSTPKRPDSSQKVKLAVAAALLLVAGGLMAWQFGAFNFESEAPPPPATDPSGINQQAADTPLAPVTQTGSGRAKPLGQK